MLFPDPKEDPASLGEMRFSYFCVRNSLNMVLS